jgi:acetyltransferase-like isoleucine patch superfamily enzyme
MIHPLADVHSTKIGSDTQVWQFAVILEGAVIGNNCNINSHTFIENDVQIGNYCTIKSGVFLWDGIVIEDHVFVGPNVTFINNKTPRSKQYPEKHIGAKIGEGASIGAASTIMSGVKIGRYAMIGAASLVTKDVPDYQLWYGSPAKHIGYVTKTGVILNANLQDEKSLDQYEFINEELNKI